MVDSLNDSSDDNFVSEISKDLDMDTDYGSLKLLDMGSAVDDDSLDQHLIQSTIGQTTGVGGAGAKDAYPPTLTDDEKAELDVRSIYVGNVDYGSTAKELEAHFRGCGAINRITILTNKFTGHPKGFAYIEFAMPDSVDTAMLLDESEFRSRQIKVMPKRTNVPGYSTTNRPPLSLALSMSSSRRGRSRSSMSSAFGGGGGIASSALGGGAGARFHPGGGLLMGGGGRPRTSRFRRRPSFHYTPY